MKKEGYLITGDDIASMGLQLRPEMQHLKGKYALTKDEIINTYYAEVKDISNNKICVTFEKVVPSLSLTLSKDVVNFLAKGGSDSVTIITEASNDEINITYNGDDFSYKLTDKVLTINSEYLGTTIKNEVEDTITVSIGDISKTIKITQEANNIVEYDKPIGKTLSVNDIPASGGSISMGTLGGMITQNCTYTSGANSTINSPTVTASSYSNPVSAESLGTTLKDRTKIGTLTYYYTCNKKIGSVSADVYQQKNEKTTISYGSWNVSIASDKYSSSSSPAYANGGTAIITSSASRSRTQNYTSGATSSLSNETASPTLSVSGSGFTLDGSNVIIANRTNIEGDSRTGSVTATYDGASKSITLYQEMNILNFVSATGIASSGTIMNMSAAGGTITWTPTVRYTSGWSGTPPSGVTITYSSSNTDATQSDNITTWPNRGVTIGKWRGSDITISAKSSYTTTPITGSVATGQNMNTVTAVNFVDCQGSAAKQSFSAAGASYCYVGELTLTSGSKTQGSQYKDYITYNFSSDFGTWTLDKEGYYGTVSAPSRNTTIGNEKSGTLTHKISGTINGVDINKTTSIELSQEGNYVTELKLAGLSISYSNISAGATASSAPSINSTGYIVTYKFTSGSSTTTKPTATFGGETTSRTYSLGSVVNGFTAVNSSTGVLTATNRGTTIGNARTSGTVTLTNKVTWTPSSSYSAGGVKTATITKTATCTQNGNYITKVLATDSNISYPTISAGANSASPILSTRGVSFTYSSGLVSSDIPSATYGTLSTNIDFSLGSVVNGFTAVNADTGVLTATNRGTTIGNARTSGVVTYTVTRTWTPTSSYNAEGVKTDTSIKTATCTQALNTIESLIFMSGVDKPAYFDYPASGGPRSFTMDAIYSSGVRRQVGSYYNSYSSYSFNQSWGTWSSASSTNKYYGRLTVASRSTTIGAARSGVLTGTVSGTINGVSVNKSVTATITQALNKVTAVALVPSSGHSDTTNYSSGNFTAAGGTKTPTLNCIHKLTLSSGSTYNTTGSGSFLGGKSSISRTWSMATASGFSINTSNGAVTAANRGTIIGAARTCNPKCVISGSFTNPSSVGSTVVNATSVTDSFTLTQALNKMEALSIIPSAGASDTTSYPSGNFAASGGTKTPSKLARAVGTFSSGSQAYTGTSGAWHGGTLTLSRSWSMAAATGFSINTSNGAVTAANRGTIIGAARTCNPKCVISVSFTNPSSVGSTVVNATSVTDSFTLTQKLNTVTSSKIVPMSGNSSDVNFPASSASRGFIGEITLSSGSKIQGSDYRNYITYSLTSSFGTWTPNAEKYYGIVTVSSRGTIIGGQKTGILTHKILGTINGVTVDKTATITLTQAANEKYKEYSNLVGNIASTTWASKANYTSFWATGTYTEKYTSGATGATGSDGIPWDSIDFGGADWCYWDDVQGVLKWYDNNTYKDRSTTITGKIGSWTYPVKVTQKAGGTIGRLYLKIPVNIGYVEYWNIKVNSTSGGQIWSGNPDTNGSSGSILKMPEECAIIVATNGGTVSFRTTYSTATDRNYYGAITGTEQDQLKSGNDVTVNLS